MLVEKLKPNIRFLDDRCLEHRKLNPGLAVVEQTLKIIPKFLHLLPVRG